MVLSPRRRFVLASASPSRLRLLRAAGLAPDVVVSGFDEASVMADSPGALVLALAVGKATAVADRLRNEGRSDEGRRHDGSRGEIPTAEGAALVLGCDSLFEIDGTVMGKPASAEEAFSRLQRLRGRAGVLRTGHCLIDTGDDRQVSAAEGTTVRFGHYTDAELAAYVATGEPVEVAGGFTLDGRSAPFIDGVDGDPSNVIGLSLPLLRRLLNGFGISIVDLWEPVS